MDEQNIKQSDGKLQVSLVPTSTITSIAKVLTGAITPDKNGEIKYTANSWLMVKRERLVDALLRHTILYLEDPDGVDADTGLLHSEHMLTNAAFLNHFAVGASNGLSYTGKPPDAPSDLSYRIAGQIEKGYITFEQIDNGYWRDTIMVNSVRLPLDDLYKEIALILINTGYMCLVPVEYGGTK